MAGAPYAPRMCPVQRTRARVLAGEGVVAGVLSGTSADGIDVGLERFPRADAEQLGRPELLEFATEPFPDELGARVRAVLDGETPGLAGLAALDRDLGRAFGRAAQSGAVRAGVRLDLVGSQAHGWASFARNDRILTQRQPNRSFARRGGCDNVP